MFGGNVGDVQCIPQELAWWFWVERRHVGQLVPWSDRVGDSASLELIALRVSSLNISGAKTIGLDVFVVHDVTLRDWLDEGRV